MQPFRLLAVVATLLAAANAHAAFSVSAGPASPVAGVITEDFDGVSTFARVGGTVYSSSTPNTAFTSDKVYLVSGLSAQPFKGSSQTAASMANDSWLSINTGQTSTLSFAAASYVGFLWGSIDTYNTVRFYNGASLLDTFTGSSLPPASGFQGQATYFGYNAASITSVQFSSSGTAFEVDNVSITPAPVPEPETYALMLAGLGAVGFIARRRRAH
jgi:hypothetical protein